MATKKVETKVAKAKEAKEAAKEVVKEVATKATAAKKAAATKKTTKKEMKVNAVVQFAGKEVEEKEIIANVKKAWTSAGNKIGDIKTMDLYIKPEEAAVYYVINGTEAGSVAF